MIITCGNCLSKFKVAPDLIKESGSKVRCSNCQYVFTVYRPGNTIAPEEAVLPLQTQLPLQTESQVPQSDPLADFLNDITPKKERLADTPAQGDHDDFSFSFEETTESPKAGKKNKTDDFDLSIFDDDDDDLDDFALDDDPRPPLRRARRQSEDNFLEEGMADKSQTNDFKGNEKNFEPEKVKPQNFGKNLGLDENPAFEDDQLAPSAQFTSLNAPQSGPPQAEGRREIFSELDGESASFDDERSFNEDEKKNVQEKKSNSSAHLIFLILAILATILAVGIFVMANLGDSNTVALSEGEPNQPATVDNAATPLLGAPPASDSWSDNVSKAIEKLEFPDHGQVRSFLRKNKNAGEILIFTGLVTNKYDKRVSFIRIKGRLEDAEGNISAEREAYAGNILSDDELVTLPINEIQTRLAIKGGQNGSNMNVDAGREVPFMLVFDKLPENLHTYTYHIEPMSVAAGAE